MRVLNPELKDSVADPLLAPNRRSPTLGTRASIAFHPVQDKSLERRETACPGAKVRAELSSIF